MNVEKVFENVTGRKMTSDEVTRYLKFQKEFEIPDTDPTWMIFVWFEYYQRIFEQFPTSTRSEVEVVTRQVKEASSVVISAAAGEIEKTLTTAKSEIQTLAERTKQQIAEALDQSMTGAVEKAIEQITQSVAVQSAKAQSRKWLSIGIVSSLATILITSFFAWDYYSNQIEQIETAAANKIQQIEDSPPTLSLSCDLAGEQKFKSSSGQIWCTRLLSPPQNPQK